MEVKSSQAIPHMSCLHVMSTLLVIVGHKTDRISLNQVCSCVCITVSKIKRTIIRCTAGRDRKAKKCTMMSILHSTWISCTPLRCSVPPPQPFQCISSPLFYFNVPGAGCDVKLRHSSGFFNRNPVHRVADSNLAIISKLYTNIFVHGAYA